MEAGARAIPGGGHEGGAADGASDAWTQRRERNAARMRSQRMGREATYLARVGETFRSGGGRGGGGQLPSTHPFHPRPPLLLRLLPRRCPSRRAHLGIRRPHPSSGPLHGSSRHRHGAALAVVGERDGLLARQPCLDVRGGSKQRHMSAEIRGTALARALPARTCRPELPARTCRPTWLLPVRHVHPRRGGAGGCPVPGLIQGGSSLKPH